MVFSFPPEVWASIIKFVSLEQIGRLKMTGSKRLWHKIAAKDVMKSVILGSDVWNYTHWPTFLKELLFIEELEISCIDMFWWYNLQPKLNKVPSTLKKLKITGPTPSSFFQGDTPYSLKQYVPLLEDLEVMLIWGHQYPWSTCVPPTLKKLSIQGWDGMTPFPKSLIHLSVSHTDLTPHSEEACASLQALETVEAARCGSDLRSTTIRSLILTHCFTMADMARFPSTLTTLEKLQCRQHDLVDPANAFSTFPYLTSLVADGISPKFWCHLPRTLKKLELGEIYSDYATIRKSVQNPLDGQNYEFGTPPIHLLPASIEKLNLDFWQLEYLDCTVPPHHNSMGMFPPLLTSLELRNAQLSVEAAKQLPSSLKNLLLSNLDKDVCEFLPRSLTQLDALSTEINSDLIKHLPKALFSVTLKHANAKTPWIDPKTGQTVNFDSLSDERQKVSPITWQAEESLPPNLTSLELSSSDRIEDSFLSQNLQNLQRLCLTSELGFSDGLISLLPPNITHLYLGSKLITGQCFPYLPRGLTELTLSGSSIIFDYDIKHLPRSLELVDLPRAAHLSDKCIIDFPRALRYLNLGTTRLTEAMVPNLPYHVLYGNTFSASTFIVQYGDVFYPY